MAVITNFEERSYSDIDRIPNRDSDGSQDSFDDCCKKCKQGTDGQEFIPTRSIKVVSSKPANNPMQFIKVGPASLYRSAQEQLSQVAQIKPQSSVGKADEEEWQTNLDCWKSSRRKLHEKVIERLQEVRKFETEGYGQSSRKSKTFTEMVEERSRQGKPLPVPLFLIEEDVPSEPASSAEPHHSRNEFDSTVDGASPSVPQTRPAANEGSRQDSKLEEYRKADGRHLPFADESAEMQTDPWLRVTCKFDKDRTTDLENRDCSADGKDFFSDGIPNLNGIGSDDDVASYGAVNGWEGREIAQDDLLFDVPKEILSRIELDEDSKRLILGPIPVQPDVENSDHDNSAPKETYQTRNVTVGDRPKSVEFIKRRSHFLGLSSADYDDQDCNYGLTSLCINGREEEELEKIQSTCDSNLDDCKRIEQLDSERKSILAEKQIIIEQRIQECPQSPTSRPDFYLRPWSRRTADPKFSPVAPVSPLGKDSSRLNNFQCDKTVPNLRRVGQKKNDFYNHWLVQEAEQRRIQEQQVRNINANTACAACNHELGRGAAMVIDSLSLYFHVNCFKCCVCGTILGCGTHGTNVRIRGKSLHCSDCFSSREGTKFTRV